MIPKKIHQIYFNWDNKPIDEIKLFKTSIDLAKEKNKDYEYKLWSRKHCEELIQHKYPAYKDFYKYMRYDIQRVDFIRFCILHSEGGFYMDLDMHTIKNFDPLLNERIIMQSNRHMIPKHPEFVMNDFMASEKGFKFWELVMQECKENYKDKQKIEVYNTWKGRFVLQTTGPRFLSRCVKKMLPSYNPHHVIWTKWRNELYKQMPRDDYYVECFRAGSWLNKTNKNLKTHKTFK
tara:strand:- start:346 stop:1047 length:702 start_codon:yes stop_codon:yes gene_type:complete